jgi:hypothetical protein
MLEEPEFLQYTRSHPSTGRSESVKSESSDWGQSESISFSDRDCSWLQ